MLSLDEFFHDRTVSKTLFEALCHLIDGIGPVEYRVTKSQITLHRNRPFAWVWMPGKYLHGKTAPLVLSLSFHHPDPSPRWKEIVEPVPGRFMHHLELYGTDDIDNEVRVWLHSAWEAAE